MINGKLLFVCYDGYNVTNTRVRCYGFARELKKQGIETEVFSFKDTLHAKYDGFESFRSGFFERLGLLAKAVSKLMKEDRSTIFYVQKSGYFALAPLLVHLLKGNRIILDYDDYEYEQSRVSGPILRMIAKNSVFCVAASRHLQSFLKKFNKNVYCIVTAVDTSVFRPKSASPKRKDVVFAWIGFIVDRGAMDNIMFIIGCFEELVQKHANIRLEIIGGGANFGEVRSRLAKLNHERIAYKGTMAPDKIPEYLSTVDVGLFVLTKPSEYNISKSPTKLFEYMAKGLPVISTNVGESGRIIEHRRNGLIAKNREEFIKCAELLTKDSRLRARLGKAAYLAAEEKYSLASQGRKLSQIIQKEC